MVVNREKEMIRIKTKLTSSTLKLKNVKRLIGKEVEITIREAKDKEIKHKWNYSGSIDLKGKLDGLNLRDAAYE